MAQQDSDGMWRRFNPKSGDPEVYIPSIYGGGSWEPSLRARVPTIPLKIVTKRRFGFFGREELVSMTDPLESPWPVAPIHPRREFSLKRLLGRK